MQKKILLLTLLVFLISVISFQVFNNTEKEVVSGKKMAQNRAETKTKNVEVKKESTIDELKEVQSHKDIKEQIVGFAAENHDTKVLLEEDKMYDMQAAKPTNTHAKSQKHNVVAKREVKEQDSLFDDAELVDIDNKITPTKKQLMNIMGTSIQEEDLNIISRRNTIDKKKMSIVVYDGPVKVVESHIEQIKTPEGINLKGKRFHMESTMEMKLEEVE